MGRTLAVTSPPSPVMPKVRDTSKPRSGMDDATMSDFMGHSGMDMGFERDYSQVPTTNAPLAPTKSVWVLDFTNDGSSNGITMTPNLVYER